MCYEYDTLIVYVCVCVRFYTRNNISKSDISKTIQYASEKEMKNLLPASCPSLQMLVTTKILYNN